MFNTKTKHCSICNKLIWQLSKYCRSCAHLGVNHKGNKNSNFIDGRTLKKHHCPFCGKQLSSYQARMCVSCARKRQKRTHNGNNYPKCVDCGKKLSHYKSIRCHSCAGKYKWQNKKYREQQLKKMFNAFDKKPNKKEILLNNLLNNLLPKEYKYVGDGKVFINGFVPDFVNCNGQKKIIELFGDYWHNIKGAKKRDKSRLKNYTKYGYKTLVIWEKELTNKTNLIKKIKEF